MDKVFIEDYYQMTIMDENMNMDSLSGFKGWEDWVLARSRGTLGVYIGNLCNQNHVPSLYALNTKRVTSTWPYGMKSVV
jgi:hypothetical protein